MAEENPYVIQQGAPEGIKGVKGWRTYEGWQDAKRPNETELEKAMMELGDNWGQGSRKKTLRDSYFAEIDRKLSEGERLSPEEAYVAKGREFSDFIATASGMGTMHALTGEAISQAGKAGYLPSVPSWLTKFTRPLWASLAAGPALALPAGYTSDKHAAYYQNQKQREALSRNPVTPY